MLVLSRKLNERIIIDGGITIEIVRINRDVVRLGITAPKHIAVHREEVAKMIEEESKEATKS